MNILIILLVWLGLALVVGLGAGKFIRIGLGQARAPKRPGKGRKYQ